MLKPEDEGKWYIPLFRRKDIPLGIDFAIRIEKVDDPLTFRVGKKSYHLDVDIMLIPYDETSFYFPKEGDAAILRPHKKYGNRPENSIVFIKSVDPDNPNRVILEDGKPGGWIKRMDIDFIRPDNYYIKSLDQILAENINGNLLAHSAGSIMYEFIDDLPILPRFAPYNPTNNSFTVNKLQKVIYVGNYLPLHFITTTPKFYDFFATKELALKFKSPELEGMSLLDVLKKCTRLPVDTTITSERYYETLYYFLRQGVTTISFKEAGHNITRKGFTCTEIENPSKDYEEKIAEAKPVNRKGRPKKERRSEKRQEKELEHNWIINHDEYVFNIAFSNKSILDEYTSKIGLNSTISRIINISNTFDIPLENMKYFSKRIFDYLIDYNTKERTPPRTAVYRAMILANINTYKNRYETKSQPVFQLAPVPEDDIDATDIE